MLIDTHIHLDNKAYREDIEAVIARGREAGIDAFVIPGADPADLERAQGLAHAHEDVFFTVGVHPYDARAYDEARLLAFADDPKCVAVGECGLDYYRLPEEEAAIAEEKALQKAVFKAQIRLAKRLKKPLIVHIREASEDAMALLLEEEAGEVGGVLHCYNADEALLKLADHGFYYGIGGVLTFKNAKKLPHVLLKIPKERLVIETDGPYLTPHPHRGKRNEPAYCTLVAGTMASMLGMEPAELAEMTRLNSLQLFSQMQVKAG